MVDAIVVLLASLAVSAVVAMLKGRWNLLLFGVMGAFPLLWVAAVRLAAPDSWWARRFYGDERRARAARLQSRWDREWAE